MAGESRWIFTRAQLIDTPSRKCGIDSDKELNYRQQTANFIQDMGQRLQVTQLCINTAIVYMHRFYMFHSFTKFNRNNMAAACLFLAAKVEEQPRKLEHVIKVSHMCLHRETLDPKSDMYLEQAQELVVNENILLQTLGFDIQVDHPHTHVVKTCQLVRASKDLAQTSYFLATNSLHLTSMCLQNKPTVVACVCIHLACKWSNWEIPQSNEGREWFWYTDKDVTLELLEALTQDFLTILDRCPSKLKKKILTWKVCIEKKMHELSGRDGAEGTEPTPLMTSRKSSSTTASSSSASASSSSTSAAPSSSSAARSQSRRSNPSAPAPSSSQPAAAPPVVPAAATDAQPQVKLEPGVRVPSAPAPAEAGTMRRVKTEPALHQKLTPKEYSERRKEREMKEHQQRAQQNSKLPTSQAPPVPPSSMSQDLKERHHMDIFSHASAAGASEQAKPVAHDTQDGASRVEGQRSRERPHGEQHHRSHQAGMADTQHRRPHDAHRHHPGAPPSHKAPPSGHPTQQQSHSERHQQPSGKGNAHEHSNNGHSEPQRHDNVPIKVEVKVEPKENHAPAPHVQPPQPPSSHSEPPPSSSQQKDLKIKINRKSHGVSPSAEINNEKVNPLKMKIKLPVSPSMSRREERSHKSSPLTSGDGLKIKLDLKGHRSHSADDRHSHSKPIGQPGDGQGSEKGEYQLTNQGTNSLKLVISKGKLSGSSSMDSPGNEKSSKRHHSHHRTGEKHHSRKRGAPTSSPQEPPRTVSTSRGHSMAHGNPSKMHRTDSGGDLRHHMNSLPDGHLPPTNGTHTSSPGLPPNPNDQHAAAKLEQIQQTQKQLEQLINLHRRQMEATQGQPLNTNFGMMPQHMAGHGQPPLPPPPPNDGHILPPPPPPPTEPPYLPPYSY